MTRRSTGARASIPWWRRFHARIIAALVLQGVVSVAASAYLVRLSVRFFDARLTSALGDAQEVVDAVQPMYRAQLDAQAQSMDARTALLAHELAALGAERPAQDPLDPARALAGDDLGRLVLREPSGAARSALDLRPIAPDAPIYVARSPWPAPSSQATLEATFLLDQAAEARFQQVGRTRRALVARRTGLAELDDAVLQAVALLSAAVLLFALLLGFGLARAATRKVAALTRVMELIARGDHSQRVPPMGKDELGQLGEALNAMLDALEEARQKVAYLQRVAAWQGMARRLAHEIKNPLTPIALAVAQIREKDPGIDPAFSRTLQTAAEIVEDEVEALRRMVASFSRFAKLPEVHPAPVALRRVLGEFERAYGHLTDREGDRLEVCSPGPEVWVEADRALIKQALVNLVENAVQVQRERGPVHVRISAASGGKGGCLILVDDNGPGVPPSRRDAVFEPYETGREHGTGLGLAIVKKVILAHGGDVRVEDSPLGGARFVIRLRVAATPEDRPAGDEMRP